MLSHHSHHQLRVSVYRGILLSLCVLDNDVVKNMGTSSKVFRLKANVYDGFENEFVLFLYFVHCVLTSLEHVPLMLIVIA